MRVINDALVYAVVGSAGFWSPSIILYAFKGAEFSLFQRWVVLAAVQPLTTLATLMTMRLLRRESATPSRCAKWMLLGIWILGPFCMFTGFTVGGGGFANDGAWLDLAVMTLLFPLLTPWLSLYDGSIIGLLLSSILLGAVACNLRAILHQRFAGKFSKLRTPEKGLACKSHSD